MSSLRKNSPASLTDTFYEITITYFRLFFKAQQMKTNKVQIEDADIEEKKGEPDVEKKKWKVVRK